MKIFLALLLLGLSCPAWADPNLGQPLPFQLNGTGKPAFSVAYTYGDDPDGPSYLLNYLPKNANSEPGRTLRWNYYSRSQNAYLASWSADRVTSSSYIMIRMVPTAGLPATLISAVLVAQKKFAGKNDLSLVLANDRNEPVWFIALSELCASYPKQFRDLTYDKACDQLQP